LFVQGVTLRPPGERGDHALQARAGRKAAPVDAGGSSTT
jgi:hypothetical protein